MNEQHSMTQIPDMRAMIKRARPPKVNRDDIEARGFIGLDRRVYSTRSSKPKVRKIAKRTFARSARRSGVKG